MMLSQYTPLKGSLDEFKAQELAEFEELIARINYFIIRMSGSYAAALELLEKHGIESRLNLDELDIAGNPIDLLSDIMHLGNFISSIKEVHEHKHKQAQE